MAREEELQSSSGPADKGRRARRYQMTRTRPEAEMAESLVSTGTGWPTVFS
jgi:hypothetical protein